MKFCVGVSVLLAIAAVVTAGRRQAAPSCQSIATAAGNLWEVATGEDAPPFMCSVEFAAGYFHGVNSGEDVGRLACLVAESNRDPEALFRALDEGGHINSDIRMMYDAFAASVLTAIPPSFRDDATGELERKCFGAQPSGGIPGVSMLDVATLVGALERLGTLNFDPEGARLMSAFMVSSSTPPHFPDTCTSSDVGDKNDRCHLLKRAFTPVWDQILASPATAMGLRMALGTVQSYTGIDLHTDLQNAAPNLACKVGELENLSELRQLLEELDVKSTLLPLAMMNLDAALSYHFTNAGNVIEYPEGHSQWEVAMARATVDLWNAWRDFDQGPPPRPF